MKFTINLPIYECKVIVFIVDTIEDVPKQRNLLFKKHKLINLSQSDASWGEALSIEPYHYLILSRQSFKDFNTIFHEMYHLIDEISKFRDISDSEAKAYLQGFLGNIILTKLIKSGNIKF